MAAIDLYLDLLKKSLTNTIFFDEPDANQENELLFAQGFLKHYIKGSAVSMLPVARLDNLQTCIADVLRCAVPGDLCETGVWRGGSTIFMRAVLKAHEVTDRTVWVADSFEGLPKPDAAKFPTEAVAHESTVMKSGYKHFAASLDEVKRNFKAYGMLDEQVRFLQGWFKDTLPKAPITQLSLLRLDGDYYESTWDALSSLYDRVSVGGYIIIDDYGEDTWTYCRKAVDDFRSRRRISDQLIGVDSKCHYWRRTT